MACTVESDRRLPLNGTARLTVKPPATDARATAFPDLGHITTFSEIAPPPASEAASEPLAHQELVVRRRARYLAAGNRPRRGRLTYTPLAQVVHRCVTLSLTPASSSSIFPRLRPVLVGERSFTSPARTGAALPPFRVIPTGQTPSTRPELHSAYRHPSEGRSLAGPGCRATTARLSLWADRPEENQWLGGRDSNPDNRVQSAVSYR